MKVLLIIVALCLAGWSIKYEDRIGDFNEKRWKEPKSIDSPIFIAEDIHGNIVKYAISLSQREISGMLFQHWAVTLYSEETPI